MKKSTCLLTLLLTALFCLPWGSSAWAYDPVTVADGETTNSYLPVYGWGPYYGDYEGQYIYPSSMLSDVPTSEITQLTFYTTSSYANLSWGVATFDVILSEISATSLSGIVEPSSPTTVYSGTLSVSGSEMVVNFTEGFVYTHGSNLLVYIKETAAGSYATVYFNGITNTAGSSYYRYNSGSTKNSSAFLPKMKIVYGDVPTCKVPTNLAASATSNSATITWNVGNTSPAETEWNLKYKKSTDAVWNEHNGLTTTTFALSGLESHTTYNVQVQSVCSALDNSAWKSINFTTPYGLPFSENFNGISSGIPENWDNSEGNAGSYKWVYSASGNTGACVTMNSYNPQKNKYNLLKTPQILVTGPAKLSFYYKNQNGGNMVVQYQVEGGTVKDLQTIGQKASWTQITDIALPDECFNKNVTIIFKGISNYGSGNVATCSHYLDDVLLESSQDCSAPKNVEAAQSGTGEVTASWDENTGVTEYQYCIVASGEAADWSGNLTTSTNSVTVGELAAGNYDFYVKCVCGGDASDAAPFTIESCQAISDVAHASDVYNGTTVTWANGGSGPWAVAYSSDGVNWTTANASVAERSCAVTGLTTGTTYTIKVSSDCTEATTTYTPACPALGALTLSGEKYNGVTVSWSAVEGISTWTLKYRKGSDSWTEVNNIAALTYTIESGLATNEEYTIELYSECGGSPATITYTPIYEIPAVLTPSLVKDVTATLNWSTVDGASGYQYSCVKTGQADAWSATQVANSVALSGLEAAEEYTAKVRAVFGGSNYSDPKEKVFSTVCQAPVSLVKGETSSSSLAFSWSKSAEGNADNRYQYVCKTGAATPTADEWSTNGVLLGEGVRAVTVEGLNANTTYYFFVRSYYGEGKYSSALSGNNKTDCGTVALPFAVEGFDHSGALPDCWDNSSHTGNAWTMDSYNYYKSASYSARYNANGTTDKYADLKTPRINLTEAALLKFYYRNKVGSSATNKVTAEVWIDNGATTTKLEDIGYATSGETVLTAQASMDLSAYTGKTVNIIFRGHGYGSSASLYIDNVEVQIKPITVPTGLTATPTTDGAIVSWTHAENGPFDLRYRVNGAEPEAEWIEVNTINDKTKTLTGLTAGTEYEVQVRANISAHRISSWTASQTFSPECVAPVGIDETAHTYNSVSLAWTGAAKALRYKTGEDEWTSVPFSPAKSAHTIEDLTPGSAYTVQVQAACATDDTKWSDAFLFTPNYVAPSGVVVDNITATSADVAWTANSGEASWTLQYKKTADAGWTTVENVTNPYTITGLSSATNYQVHVAAGTFYSETASFPTECGTLTPLGYTEDFEDMETGSYADDKLRCWETLNAVHTGINNPPYVYVGTEAQNGSKGMTFRGSASTPVYAILPEFSGSYEGLQLAFSHKKENASNSGKVILGYMTNIAQASSFEPLMSEITDTRSTSWTNALVSLNSVPDDARLAFRYGGGSNNWDAYVDDIAITAIPSCAIPTDLDATNISISGATLSWTSDADKWDIQYSTNPDFSSYSSVPGVTDKLYNLTGLSANTLYYVRVKADCGSGNKSEWSIATSFRTECEIKEVAEDSPWTENFTSGHTVGEAPYCWETIPSVNNSSVSTTVTADGELDIYQHNTNTEIAVLPVFSMDIKNLRISFKYRNSNDNSSYASLEVGYVVGDTFYPVQTLAKATSSTSATDIEMPADAVTTARIAFRLTNTNNRDSHVYVDDIEVALKETCKTPVNVQRTVLTDEGATFTWEASKLDETQYQYACVDADVVLTDGDWVLLADGLNTVTITGKTVGNNYDFYVRSYCDVDKQSRPTEKVTFSPVCAGLATPSVSAVTNNSATITWVGNAKSLQHRIYKSEEPFNSWTTETIPTADKAAPYALNGLEAGTKYEVRIQSFCATTDDELWSGVVSFTTWCGLKDAAELPLNENFDGKSALPACWEKISASEYPQVTNNVLWFQGTDEQIVVLPGFDIALDKLSLSFTYSANNASIELGYLVEANGTFNSLSAVTSGEEIDLSTTSAPASAGYLAIRYYNATSSLATGSVDNIVLRKTPSCVKPTNVAAGSITPSSASISWDSEASAWNLQYKTGSADWTEVAVSENPYMLNGLAQGAAYQVRVQADCGSGDLSDWSDVAEFTTSCEAVAALPFTETFDGALSNCWSITDDNTTTYAHNVYSGELRLPGGKAASGHLVVLPEISASLENATMTIEYTATAGDNTATPQVGYIDNESAFQELAALAKSGSTAITARVELADADGHRLALRYDDGTSDGDFNIREIRILEHLTLTDNTDNFETLNAHLNKAVDVTIGRTFVCADYYNTICLPFSLSAEELAASPIASNDLWAFYYARVEGGELLIRIVETDHINAGEPYLIAWPEGEDIENPLFKNVTISASAGKVMGSENLKFVGTLKPEVFAAHDDSKLFLYTNNTLYWWNGDSDSSLKSFRAFFTVEGGAGTTSIKHLPARLVKSDHVATDINNVQSYDVQSTKMLENGHVVIIRNGVKYSVTGQKIQ